MEPPTGPGAVKTDATLNSWTRQMEDNEEPTPHLLYAPLGTEEASFEPAATWGCSSAERIGPYQAELLNTTLGELPWGWGGEWRNARTKRP